MTMIDLPVPPLENDGPSAPPRKDLLFHRAWLVLRAVQVRLRFFLVLLAIFLIVGKWDALRNYWDKLTRSWNPPRESVSGQTEYWCPMCPGVISDWPAKCPVCNMTLVQRKRGEAVPLPDGVLARMQLSPYRIQLAGIKTSVVDFHALRYQVTTAGLVDYDDRRVRRLTAPVAGKVQPLVTGGVGAPVKQGDALLAIHVPEPLADPDKALPDLIKNLKAFDIGKEDVEMPARDGSQGFRITLRSPMAGQVVAFPPSKDQHLEAGKEACAVAELSQVLVKTEVFSKDLPFVREGKKVEVTSEALPGQPPLSGRVRVVTGRVSDNFPILEAWLEVENPRLELRPGMMAMVRTETPTAEIEPFRSMPSGPVIVKPGEPRNFYICPDHLDLLRDQPGKCPLDQNELTTVALASNQRLGWWCPMHPAVTADKAGCACDICKGMKLLPRVITHSPPGQVLAVPETAVLDTGAKKMVYLERMPGMFDGVEVVLGPRCGDFFPVIRGLEPGQKVVSAGAFLIDAETRLNPNVAAGYFGASQGSDKKDATPSPAQQEKSSTEQALQLLSKEDRALAVRQKLCPVTDEPLGSMGKPFRVVLEGRVVFLCCKGCEEELRKNPGPFLAKVKSK